MAYDATPQAAPDLRFRCVSCNLLENLCSLNDELICTGCLGEGEDPEGFEDMSVAAMRREFGTWAV